jgi:hypothetical protein
MATSDHGQASPAQTTAAHALPTHNNRLGAPSRPPQEDHHGTDRRLRARLKDAIRVGIDRVIRHVGYINIRAQLAPVTLGHAAYSVPAGSRACDAVAAPSLTGTSRGN